MSVAAQTVTLGSATVNPLGLVGTSVNTPDFRLDLVVRNQAMVPAVASIDVARVIIDYVTATIVNGTPTGVTFSSVSSAAGEVAWTTPENARTADAQVTESVLTQTARSTELLRATGWGFSLPPNVVVSGVILTVRRRNVLGSSLIDRRVALVQGATTLGTWPAGSNQSWGSALADTVWGDVTNRWMAQLTAAEVNAPDFGIELGANTLASGTPGRPAVDEVRLSVAHSPTPQVTAPTAPSVATSFEPRQAWMNPGNAAMQDTSYATVTFMPGLTTQRLVVSGFNFGLPAGAFVSGVQVQVRKSVSVMNSIRDEVAQLRLGPVTSLSRTDPNAFWFLAFNVETYGSPSERWGLTNELSAEAVSAADAAFVLSATSNALSATAQVDSVQATVHWCPAP